MPTLVAAINSTKLTVKLGDGASPEVFTHPCMINTSRGIVFNSNTIESLVPYCPPDDDDPGWLDREVDSFSAEISGAGIFDGASLTTFWTWWESGLSKNIQVQVNLAGTVAAGSGGFWSGAALLTTFGVQGAGRREKVTFDCTIVSDGPWIWT